MTAADDRTGFELNTQVGVVWPEVSELPVLAANQFAVQITGGEGGRLDEIVLTIGHVASPLLSGTPEEQRAQISQITQLTIQPIARFAVTRYRLAELRELLDSIMSRWDEQRITEEDQLE
jgi:hypothetical protein